MTRIAGPRLDQTETQFDGDLFRSSKSLARRLGWSSYHTLRSRGSKAGYPDRTLWRDRLILAELKTEKTKPTDLQVLTLTELAKAGAEVYLWRPSDLDEIGQILGRRWRFDPHGDVAGGGEYRPVLSFVDGSYLRPASSWLPTGNRRDAS